ncbi:helix-turn-helix domain-containing protein [Embleya sp. AB8]|uniref:helix-turn-helix domain-containing protein n=1 Tax=Embleya sp. AB8 TaxID=3156304 RepID=UPI003C73443A
MLLTLEKRQLADELKMLRKKSALTGKQVAEALGVSEPLVNRMENAKRAVNNDNLTKLLDLYRVQGDERKRLVDLFERSVRDEPGDGHWWSEFENEISASYRDYIELEHAAAAVVEYQPQGLNGLVQTEEYAYALTAAWGMQDEDRLEAHATVRVKRSQSRIFGPERLHFTGFFTESALHMHVKSRATMIEQFDHLVRIGRFENVELHMIPFETLATATLGSGFTVFQFDAINAPKILVQDAVVGRRSISEEPRDLREIDRHVKRLKRAALSAQDTLAFVEKHIRKLESR